MEGGEKGGQTWISSLQGSVCRPEKKGRLRDRESESKRVTTESIIFLCGWSDRQIVFVIKC